MFQYFQVEAEATKLTKAERYRAALSVARIGIIIFDRERLFFINELAEEYLGTHSTDLIGSKLSRLRLPGLIPEAVERALNFCRKKQGEYSEKFVLGERHFRLKATSASDHTTLLTIESSLAQHKWQAFDQDREEVSKPVNLVPRLLKLADLISREVPPGGEASYLCHELLTEITKPNYGQNSPQKNGPGSNKTEVFTICRELFSVIRYSLPENVRIEADIPLGSSGAYFSSAELRRLIILGSLEAAKEIPKGGLLSISARKGEESVIIRIVSKPGENIEKVSPTDRVALNELKTICEKLGGTLVSWCERGTRVRLMNLPASEAKTGFGTTTLETIEGQGKTILLIDDEEVVRAVAETALSKLGYSIKLARDGLEGVEIYKKEWHSIDLVVLDLVMPRLGGAGCFEKLKEINPEVKVVLMSGFTRNRRVNDLMSKGCLFFLRKPFELKDLVSVVREVSMAH